MKVIDLLNKIANGEEVKFKILDNDEIKDEIFEVENGSLRNRTCGKWIEAKVSIDTWESISSYFLNKEVEVIEEDKKIEKLEHMNSRDYLENRDEYLSTKGIALDIETLRNWINKIIDYINKEK